MAEASRIATIGGGIIGASIAWRLAQRGFDVTIFERGQFGREASWAAAGMLSPSGEIELESQNAELLIESRRMYRRFVEELGTASGLAIDYQDCGAIDLAFSEEEWRRLRERQARHTALGLRSRELTAGQVRTFSPHANSDALVGALFCPDDAVVAPRDLMTALRVALDRSGVQIRENSRVERIAQGDRHVSIANERFQSAVIAAGAWSSAIAIEGAPPLPQVEPVRGHLLAYDLQLGACPTIVRHEHLYAFQRGSGVIIAGASMERVGFNRTVAAAIVSDLRHRLARMMPIVERLEPVEVWTGFRPAAECLHIGHWQDSCIYLAYGHFRNGILLAPLTADRIARDIAARQESCTTANSGK